MRILLNDYAGHPFQVQLSRSLAKRGHLVLHTYCSSVLTPRGNLVKTHNDSENFDIKALSLSKPFSRYGLMKRALQERELGILLSDEVKKFKPNAVISANTPLGAQASILRKAKASKAKFVFWVQDLLGVGIAKNIVKKLPLFGKIIGRYYCRLEEKLLRQSDEVIIITEDFRSNMQNAKIPDDKVHVVPNWAPLDEVAPLPKKNLWSQKYGLDDKFNFLYSGTLGMKHNPEILLKLAIRIKDKNQLRFVVVSEGLGADYLRKKKDSLGLKNLILMPFQPFNELPFILASGDILITNLEKDAGVFAVPSKVLTYMCVKRPLIAAIPHENLASRIIRTNEAGIVVSPDEHEKFINAALRLIENKESQKFYAENSYAYARKMFDIQKITSKFEKIIRN